MYQNMNTKRHCTYGAIADLPCYDEQQRGIKAQTDINLQTAIDCISVARGNAYAFSNSNRPCKILLQMDEQIYGCMVERKSICSPNIIEQHVQ